jgi:hypothetical protein
MSAPRTGVRDIWSPFRPSRSYSSATIGSSADLRAAGNPGISCSQFMVKACASSALVQNYHILLLALDHVPDAGAPDQENYQRHQSRA